MNVLSTRVVLRERTLPEVFDLAFRFVAVRGGRKYVKLWLASCLPQLLLCIALRRSQVGWGWIWTVAAAGFVVAQIPFTLAASRLLLADDLSLAGLLRAWLPRIPGQLLMHAIAGTLIVLSGFLIVPAPLLSARLVYLPEISLLEGSNLLRAYERGSRISKYRLGHTLETCALLVALWAAFILGFEALGRSVQVDLLSLPPPSDTLANGGSWFALCGFFAAVPFLSTARFLAYIDGRTRREAWDVQLRFTELASAARGGS